MPLVIFTFEAIGRKARAFICQIADTLQKRALVHMSVIKRNIFSTIQQALIMARMRKVECALRAAGVWAISSQNEVVILCKKKVLSLLRYFLKCLVNFKKHFKSERLFELHCSNNAQHLNSLSNSHNSMLYVIAKVVQLTV